MPELTTNIDDLMGLPFYGAVGNPTTALGAGMVALGLLMRAEITDRYFVQTLANEIDQEVGKGFEAYSGGDFTLTMKRRSAAILAAVFKAPTSGTNSLGFNPSFQERDQLTLALIPRNVADPTDPTESALRWITNAIFKEIGAFIAKVEQGTSSETYTIGGTVGFAATDQAGQAINANYRLRFNGSAVDALGGAPASPWTLPAQS